MAAARFLRLHARDADVTVLEGSPRIGGKLQLDTIAGVQVDVGAEAILARRPEAVGLAREVGLGPDLVAPITTQAAIWSDDRLMPIPAGTVMGVPGDVAALEASGLFTPDELSWHAASPSNPVSRSASDTAIGEVVTRRLGAAVTDRLVEPLLGGVYAGRADLLSLDATVPLLGAALRPDSSLLGAVRAALAAGQQPAPDAPVFAGIIGGIGRLPKALAETSGAAVRTHAMVRAIERRANDRGNSRSAPRLPKRHSTPMRSSSRCLRAPPPGYCGPSCPRPPRLWRRSNMQASAS